MVTGRYGKAARRDAEPQPGEASCPPKTAPEQGGVAASLIAVGLISSPIVIAAIPLLTGLAVGYGFAAEISNPLKETWFEQKPEWYGTSP